MPFLHRDQALGRAETELRAEGIVEAPRIGEVEDELSILGGVRRHEPVGDLSRRHPLAARIDDDPTKRLLIIVEGK